MKAAVLLSPKEIKIEDVPVPQPAKGEALIKVSLVGLCGTDYNVFYGKRSVNYPLIGGHEIVGKIVEAGEGVEPRRINERVVVEPNYSCGKCYLCLEGNTNICQQRISLGITSDGGFAEYVSVPQNYLWKIPDELNDEKAVFCEPLSVAVRAVSRATIHSGEYVAIIGAGTIALMALQIVKMANARVLVVTKTDRRLNLARKLGADETISTNNQDLLAGVKSFTKRDGCDAVIEMAGTPGAAENAINIVRPGGRIILSGISSEPSTINFSKIVRNEIKIIGSMIYQKEFHTAIEMLKRGEIKTAPLVSHRFKLVDISEAFKNFTSPSSIKILIEI